MLAVLHLCSGGCEQLQAKQLQNRRKSGTILYMIHANTTGIGMVLAVLTALRYVTSLWQICQGNRGSDV